MRAKIKREYAKGGKNADRKREKDSREVEKNEKDARKDDGKRKEVKKGEAKEDKEEKTAEKVLWVLVTDL